MAKTTTGESAMQAEPDQASNTDIPALIIVWDPDVVSQDDYVKLVVLLDDFAKEFGAEGIKRMSPEIIRINRVPKKKS